jgi:transposase
MKGYSLDLRTRIVDSVKEGMPIKEAARRYKVSFGTIKRYLRLEREGGDLAEKTPVRKRKKLIENRNELEKLTRENPDLTLEELCEIWQAKGNERPSVSTMWRALNDLGLNQKKKPPNTKSSAGKKSKRTQKVGKMRLGT